MGRFQPQRRPGDDEGTDWRIDRRAQPIFDTLPASKQLDVLAAVAPLEGKDRETWPALFPGKVKKFESIPHVYVVSVPPELALLVTQTEDKGVDVVDIVRTDALEQLVVQQMLTFIDKLAEVEARSRG